jgi:hypothetical protein
VPLASVATHEIRHRAGSQHTPAGSVIKCVCTARRSVKASYSAARSIASGGRLASAATAKRAVRDTHRVGGDDAAYADHKQRAHGQPALLGHLRVCTTGSKPIGGLDEDALHLSVGLVHLQRAAQAAKFTAAHACVLQVTCCCASHP